MCDVTPPRTAFVNLAPDYDYDYVKHHEAEALEVAIACWHNNCTDYPHHARHPRVKWGLGEIMWGELMQAQYRRQGRCPTFETYLMRYERSRPEGSVSVESTPRRIPYLYNIFVGAMPNALQHRVPALTYKTLKSFEHLLTTGDPPFRYFVRGNLNVLVDLPRLELYLRSTGPHRHLFSTPLPENGYPIGYFMLYSRDVADYSVRAYQHAATSSGLFGRAGLLADTCADDAQLALLVTGWIGDKRIASSKAEEFVPKDSRLKGTLSVEGVASSNSHRKLRLSGTSSMRIGQCAPHKANLLAISFDYERNCTAGEVLALIGNASSLATFLYRFRPDEQSGYLPKVYKSLIARVHEDYQLNISLRQRLVFKEPTHPESVRKAKKKASLHKHEGRDKRDRWHWRSASISAVACTVPLILLALVKLGALRCDAEV